MLYVKYINETFSELTNGKVYFIHNISSYGIVLRNDKGSLFTYILRGTDFVDVTKEIIRNKTIDDIIA